MNRSKNSQLQDPQARARDNQTKFIKDSVNKVEKSFATLCGQMGAVNRRNGRLRDKFDEMAKFLVGHANTELAPLKVTLTQFAEHMSAIQDYRQALIERMDGKVIQPLTAYKLACKHTHTDLNTTMKSRGREMKTKRQLEQLRNKAPSDTRQITRAETDLQRATIEVGRSTKSLEETIDKFEAKRVTDIKKILSDFVQVEMLFHAKALERLTVCFQDLQNLNVEDHVVLFRNSLSPSQVQQRLDMVRQQAGMNVDPQQQEQGLPPGDIYAQPHAQRQGTSPFQSTTLPEYDGPGHQSYDQEEYDDDYSEEEEENGEEESDYGSEEEEEDEGESPQPQRQQQRLKPW